MRYTLTLDPDVALLGLSFPNEQDAAFAAAAAFEPLTQDQLADVRRRAARAIEGKGPCWWNPPAGDDLTRPRGRLASDVRPGRDEPRGEPRASATGAYSSSRAPASGRQG